MGRRTFSLPTAIFALWVLAAGPLFADGKMYSEKVNPDIPYQRALILFEEGKETLILQSQYQIPQVSGKHTIGWVVPVPSVPEIASMPAREADWLFRDLDRLSRPEITRWGFRILSVPLLMFAFVMIFSLVCLFPPSLSRHKKRYKRWSIVGACGFFSLFVATILSAGNSKGIDGVEVVKSGKVGIFDTKVIRSDSSKDLIAWLNANSFQFGPGDEKAIQAHIDRKWCFVTAKVDASASIKDSSAVSGNLLAPLILHFSTPKPVYPTALTATGGHSTEILIYLGSDGPMKTDSAMITRFRDHIAEDFIFLNLFGIEPDEFFWEKLPRQSKHLSKFKATLTPEQMSHDIEFAPDPGTPPMREHRHKW